MRVCLCFALLFAWFSTAAAEEPPSGHTDALPWFKDSFLDLPEDVADAEKRGKRLILYFHQDGCPYCAKLLRDNFGQREIVLATQRDFDVIEINLWGDRSVIDFSGHEVTEKEFAANLKVMFTPTLLFLNAAAEVVMRINGYYPPHRFTMALAFASDPDQDGQSFKSFLAQNEPPPASGRLHSEPGSVSAPFKLDHLGSDSRPLLVMFEQRECGACDELHLDVLKRPESRTLLQGFDLVVVDMWSTEEVVTPTGDRILARDWARDLGIQYAPSLVFFGSGGRELFRSEAYLRAFHVQSVLDYVSSGAWRTEPEFQRYVQARADALREQGVEVRLWD